MSTSELEATGETPEQALERVCRESWDREQSLRIQLSESQAALDGLRVLKEGAEKELKETRKDLSAEILSTQLANRRLREALKNLIWTATKLWDDAKPIKDGGAIRVTHPIIEAASEALSAPSDEQLIDRVVEALVSKDSELESACNEDEARGRGSFWVPYYRDFQRFIATILTDLKGAANE